MLVFARLVDNLGVLFHDIVVTEDDIAAFSKNLGTGMNDATLTKRDIAFDDSLMTDDCLWLATASRHTSTG